MRRFVLRVYNANTNVRLNVKTENPFSRNPTYRMDINLLYIHYFYYYLHRMIQKTNNVLSAICQLIYVYYM
jgi:hypothetical protein